MRLAWKVGDRAVFCYRPGVPAMGSWNPLWLSRVGKLGTVTGTPRLLLIGTNLHVPFRTDDGDSFLPLTLLLAPLIEGPVREAEEVDLLQVS